MLISTARTACALCVQVFLDNLATVTVMMAQVLKLFGARFRLGQAIVPELASSDRHASSSVSGM